MDDPILDAEEREATDGGCWFSSLSPALRHAIRRCACVKRYSGGERISARGAWIGCARSAIRVSSTSITGKQLTLTYVEPGWWVSNVAIVDGERRTNGSYAHIDATPVCVSRFDLRTILGQHVELYEALLRLRRSHGVPSLSESQEVRIDLQLAQEELAPLLGASRQRVHQQLKSMERNKASRVEAAGLVVRLRDILLKSSEAEVEK